MGIEAYPQLADILLGRGAAERPGAPEPTLLPHLAPIADGGTLGWLCESADLYASGGSGPPPWPDLANAVFSRVGPRLGKGEDATKLLERFPGLATFLPDEWLADALLSADSGRSSPSRAQLLVRLAARFPQHASGTLLEAARGAVEQYHGWEKGTLLGWLGAAVDAPERQAVLDEILASDFVDSGSAGAVVPHLQAPDQKRLALHLARSSGPDEGFVACQLLHLLPFVAPDVRDRKSVV